MKILCILHVDFEGMGIIAPWAHEKGHHVFVAKPYQNQTLPSSDLFDALVVMGGPQSPLKKDSYPYLEDEIAVIRHFLHQEKGVLGFCLGAQLMGEALDAAAEKSPEKEVGIYPIHLTQDAAGDPLLEGFPQTFPVMHWHYDMPGLTSQAVVLATSPGCPRQIVRYAPKAYGFQCHLEITQEGLALLTQKAARDLTPSAYTQTEEEMRSSCLEDIHQKMYLILDRFSAACERETS